MRLIFLLAAACLLSSLYGCNPQPQQINVQQPPDRRPNRIIIERDREVPPRRNSVEIDINRRCDAHNHCGRCADCRKNGWNTAIGIYIGR